jgi:hypothetical protein
VAWVAWREALRRMERVEPNSLFATWCERSPARERPRGEETLRRELATGLARVWSLGNEAERALVERQSVKSLTPANVLRQNADGGIPPSQPRPPTQSRTPNRQPHTPRSHPPLELHLDGQVVRKLRPARIDELARHRPTPNV